MKLYDLEDTLRDDAYRVVNTDGDILAEFGASRSCRMALYAEWGGYEVVLLHALPTAERGEAELVITVR